MDDYPTVVVLAQALTFRVRVERHSVTFRRVCPYNGSATRPTQAVRLNSPFHFLGGRLTLLGRSLGGRFFGGLG